MNRSNVRKILFLVVFWPLCAVFIMLYDNALMIFTRTPMVSGRDFAGELITVFVVALGGSVFAATFDVLVLSRWLRRQPLGRALAAKTAFWTLLILGLNSLAQLLIIQAQTGAPMSSPDVLERYVAYLTSPYVVMISIYFGVVVLLGLFFVQVAEKFGQGVLLSFLLGKYHRPKEEDRIFMFIDLTSSTTYAESLGHLRYSELIQDCFFDLTDVTRSSTNTSATRWCSPGTSSPGSSRPTVCGRSSTSIARSRPGRITTCPGTGCSPSSRRGSTPAWSRQWRWARSRKSSHTMETC
jgi:adenylate cyclase